jgi:GNAT superfamily N-acetyltransferase
MTTKSQFTVREIQESDLGWIIRITQEYWGDEYVVAHGVIYKPHELPGFIAVDLADTRIGLVTYSIKDEECEIVTLNSCVEGIGVGTALLKSVADHAIMVGCSRVWLITTNENIKALYFYQKRGYELVAVYRRALEKSRKIQPSLPLISEEGIPLRDEIELEFPLKNRA